jgi:ankyrin repeat protein
MNFHRYGLTPLLYAALYGHMDLMLTLLQYANNGREKHDAWKLIGATLLDKQLDLVDKKSDFNLDGAIQSWKTSFDDDIWGDEPVHMDFIAKTNEVQKRVYAGFSEAKTAAEINQLIGLPDAIQMQVDKCNWNWETISKRLKLSYRKIGMIYRKF